MDTLESSFVFPHDDTATESSAFCLLHRLPQELLDLAFRFLSGFDLLHLSHVSTRFYYGLLANDAELWERRAPFGSPLYPLQLGAPRQIRSVPAKQRYFSHESLYFHEDRTDTTRVTGGSIRAPPVDKETSGGSFSFDIFFALVPPRESKPACAGAILLGAHSSRGLSKAHHQHFARISPDGSLYCSVMNHQPIVAHQLRPSRWYHVALVFEVTAPRNATQRVYVDGLFVNTTKGWLNDDWPSLSDAWVGSSCSFSDTGTFDSYAFHGLIDDCRFWSGALQGDAVRDLARGTPEFRLDTDASWTWSVRDVKLGSAHGNISFARSTTPTEIGVRQLEATGRLSPISKRARFFSGCTLFAHVLS